LAFGFEKSNGSQEDFFGRRKGRRGEKKKSAGHFVIRAVLLTFRNLIKKI